MSRFTHLLDPEGFLRDLEDWDPQVAQYLAQLEEIDLDDAHWEVIDTLRAFYAVHQVSLANRAFVNLIRREYGPDKGQSRYLMSLFGGSPAKIAAKIAGLPKPENCL